MSNASFVCAADALAGWRDEILSGKPPVRWPLGVGELSHIEFGPGAVLLLGGPPGVGKSGFSTQLVFDALRLTPDLRAVICNVEMAPAALLDRQLARLSGIDLTLIRHRRLAADHGGRIDQALHTLEPLAERLAFCRPPFGLASVAGVADEFGARLLLLDYVQRIGPPGEQGDRRGAIDKTMDYLRQFADNGVAVIVVSAVGRGKDRKGRSSYADDALSLASYRESSELEYGCDDAFLLVPDPKAAGRVTLKHLKSRNSEPRDVALIFDARHQRFTPVATEGDQEPRPDRVKLKGALAGLWARTAPANDETEEDEDDC
jgi:replicative DNA helicase